MVKIGGYLEKDNWAIDARDKLNDEPVLKIIVFGGAGLAFRLKQAKSLGAEISEFIKDVESQ